MQSNKFPDDMGVNCPNKECGNWVQWNNLDPRRKIIGYGFEFLCDDPENDTDKYPYGKFKCCDCGSIAEVDTKLEFEEMN